MGKNKSRNNNNDINIYPSAGLEKKKGGSIAGELKTRKVGNESEEVLS